MVTVERKITMLSEFIAWVLEETKIPEIEAQYWLLEAKKGLPEELWNSFCKFAPTENTIGNLVWRIMGRMPRYIGGLKGRCREVALHNAQAFLAEICEKAAELSVELDLQHYLRQINAALPPPVD